jgi:NADH-quinone oxidoreductase subunit E
MTTRQVHPVKPGSDMDTTEEKHITDFDGVPVEKVNQVINHYQNKPGELLGTLETLQNLNHYKYIPADLLEYIAIKLQIPLSRIYSVMTFYNYFNLKPQGEHCITVCRGTACHTKGSRVILETLKDYLKLKEDPAEEGEKVFLTTVDRQFSLRTIACFGQCALSPVCEADGVIYSNMTKDKAKKLVDDVRKEAKANENRK